MKDIKSEFRKTNKWILMTSALVGLSLLNVENVVAEAEVTSFFDKTSNEGENQSRLKFFSTEELVLLKHLLESNDQGLMLEDAVNNHQSLQFEAAVTLYENYMQTEELDKKSSDLIIKLNAYALEEVDVLKDFRQIEGLEDSVVVEDTIEDVTKEVEPPVAMESEVVETDIQTFNYSYTADQYYNLITEARQASTAWELLQDFQKEFPQDNRLREVVNLVSMRNFSLGKDAHLANNFPLAITYYERIVNEPLVNTGLKSDVVIYHRQASNQETLKTGFQYYQQFNAARQASTAWELAQNFKRDYPNDHRVPETINKAAERNMILGKDAHSSNDFALALIYYKRLINEPMVSSTLRSDASAFYTQASNQETIKYGYHYYNQISNAKQASEAWVLAQNFKRDYPNDHRVVGSINQAAERNAILGKDAHRSHNYQLAVTYYTRLIDEQLVEKKLRSEVTIYNRQATNGETLKTAYQYVNQISNAQQASSAWTLAQNFKRDYPNDHRVTGALNQAAERNFILGKDAHQSNNYQLAINYYNRIINEQLVNNSIKTEVNIYHRQASNDETLKTADIYYRLFIENSQESQAWNLAQNFKRDYPNDSRISEVMNQAAERMAELGEQVHKQGNYRQAIEYYEAVIIESLVQDSIKDLARGYLAQAKRNEKWQSPENYYDKVLSASQASDSWSIAQSFKIDFPRHELFVLAINNSAERNLELGLNAHKDQNYSLAELYYNRIKSEASIYENTSIVVNELQIKAKNKSLFNTSNYYYNKSNWATGASDAWRYAIEGITIYPNDASLLIALNNAAERNLKLGVSAHENRNYSLAAMYYNRLLHQAEVDPAYRTKAESYNYLAKNKLQLTNTILRSTLYDWTLEEVLNLQMLVNPQTSSPSYQWINANRKEVEYYVNPLNFIPKNGTDITTSLVTLEIKIDNLNVRSGPGTNNKIVGSVSKGQKYTIIDYASGWYKISGRNVDGWIYNSSNYISRDNSLMQFLTLSGSSGISARDLNTELTGHGILAGRGDAFRRASIEANINEIYLIAHAVLETGRGESELANGIVVSEVDGKKVTPRRVYNMYGIGAYDSNPEKFGSERAYKEGWFTPDLAIIGGAKWISEGYINNPVNKQDTLYKMRWNPASPGVHQYATDIGWAYKQTNSLNKIILLSQKYDLVMNFDIPLYK